MSPAAAEAGHKDPPYEQEVIGSDYSHADTSSQLEALRILNHREDITPAQKKKILEDNPAALYGL